MTSFAPIPHESQLSSVGKSHAHSYDFYKLDQISEKVKVTKFVTFNF